MGEGAARRSIYGKTPKSVVYQSFDFLIFDESFNALLWNKAEVMSMVGTYRGEVKG